MSTTEEIKAQFRRAHGEVLSPGDVSAVAEVIAPDFINHEAPPGRDRGPESMRGLTTMLRTAFFDLRFAIEELVAEGDIVAGLLTLSGTLEGPLMGMPPSGNAVRQDLMHFVRFRNGKTVEDWGMRDDLGMMQQLGAIPEPGQSVEPSH